MPHDQFDLCLSLIDPPPDASPEWLAGYYAALRQVGLLLKLEGQRQEQSQHSVNTTAVSLYRQAES
jgi:hypothetical protein